MQCTHLKIVAPALAAVLAVAAGTATPSLAATSAMAAVRFTLAPSATKPALDQNTAFLITRVGPDASCVYSITEPDGSPSPPISGAVDMRGLVLGPGEGLQNAGGAPCVFSGILFTNMAPTQFAPGH